MGYPRRGAKAVFYIKLREFADNKDPRKFDVARVDGLVFFDGTSMNSWFNNNKKRILSESKEVLRQYIEIKGPVRLSFKQKLKEFEQEKNLAKYDSYNKELKFSDGVVMGSWFKYACLRIIKESDVIRLEYLKYRNGIINDQELKKVYTEQDYKKAGIPLSKRR